MRFIFGQPLRDCKPLRRSYRIAMRVRAKSGATHGLLLCGAQRAPCSFGKAGLGVKKKEGDGITPIGTFPLRAVLMNANRYYNRSLHSIATPNTRIALLRTTARSAWCDDARQPYRYNRPLAIPSRLSHETLYRRDGLYDLLLVIGFNDAPARPKRGSAIFLHAARTNKSPYPTTEGCIAVHPNALRALLPKLDRRCAIRISMVKDYETRTQTRT